MKTMRLTKKSTRNALLAALMTASLLLALSVDGVVTSAQEGFEGDYDLSFATNGYYVDQEDVDPAAADEYQSLFYTGELLPDGSIIAGGSYVSTTPSGDFYLRKFNAAGDVVTTFGSNGLVRTNFHTRHDGVPGSDTPQVLKVQPDGKIVFAGQCTTLEPGPYPARAFGVDACVVRYNANGTLDQTFGGGTIYYTSDTTDTHSTQLDPGKVIIKTGATGNGQSFGTGGIVYDMAIQPDGKIVLVGETRNYSSFHGGQGIVAFVARLNPNGALDSTFGSGGIARWGAPEGPATCFPPRRFSGVRLQADGRIIAVGYDEITTPANCGAGTRFVVTRWTAAGQLETVRHIADLSNVDQYFTERAVAAQFTNDGSKLLVSGSSRNLSGTWGRQKPTIVRLNASTLALDTTFGSGGIAQYDRVGDNWSASTLYIKAVQPDGKILGTDNTLTARDLDNVIRFNPDGTVDQSFGNYGVDGAPEGTGRLKINVTHFNSASAAINLGQILVRPNGRINLVGYSAVHYGLGVMRAVVSQQNTEIPTYTVAGRVLNGAGAGVGGVTVNLSGAQSASGVTDASGNYSFAGLPTGGNFTVTPSKAGLTFVPASKSFTNLSADQLSVNFSVPSLSVNNITVTEGNTGETTATFTVKLQPVSTLPVTVKYQTANSTALAPGDYTALALTSLTFDPGQSVKTVAVKVKGDTLDEANETFRLLLSAPANALITDNEGVCTVNDNDAPPSISVGNVPVTEGNSATTATFSIILSTASAQTVTVKYQTVNKTAVAGRDYTAKPLTTLTFAPFQTTKTVPVSVMGDVLDEPAETFNFVLSSPTNATIGVPQAACTITDNDPKPTIAITNVSVTEPDAGTAFATFTIKLQPASGQTVTVKYATGGGTATAGTDYTALPLTTVTFSPGQTTKTVTVQVKGDTAKEAGETFFLNLSGATNATIIDAQGQGTITNDD